MKSDKDDRFEGFPQSTAYSSSAPIDEQTGRPAQCEIYIAASRSIVVYDRARDIHSSNKITHVESMSMAQRHPRSRVTSSYSA